MTFSSKRERRSISRCSVLLPISCPHGPTSTSGSRASIRNGFARSSRRGDFSVIGARRGVTLPCTSTRIPGQPSGSDAANIASISSTGWRVNTTSIGHPACPWGSRSTIASASSIGTGWTGTWKLGSSPNGKRRSSGIPKSIGSRRAAMTARPAGTRWASIRRGRRPCMRRRIRKRRRFTWPAKTSFERSRRPGSTSSSNSTTAPSILTLATTAAWTGGGGSGTSRCLDASATSRRPMHRAHLPRPTSW